MISGIVTTPPSRWICSQSSWRNGVMDGSLLQRVRSAVTIWPTRAREMSRASAISVWLGQWLGGCDF